MKENFLVWRIVSPHTRRPFQFQKDTKAREQDKNTENGSSEERKDFYEKRLKIALKNMVLVLPAGEALSAPRRW